MSRTRQVGNGEGSLYYSESEGKYIYQYFVNGSKKKIRQGKKETLRDFKIKVTKLKQELNDGVYIGKRNETLIDIIEEHIKNKNNDGITADGSYSRELDTLEQIKSSCSDFCNKPIQNVTIRDIQKAKEKIKEYSDSCIGKIWRLLNKAFEIASSPSRKILSVNIMLDTELKKPISNKKTKKVKALTEAEYNRLIYVLDNQEKNHPYRNVVLMQLISGMRISETLSRSINDYDEKTKQFNVHNTLTKDKNSRYIIGTHTKTYNKKTGIDEGQRYLPLSNSIFSKLIDIIEEQKNKKITNINQLLFWNYEINNVISPNSINSWLKALDKKYNICDKKSKDDLLNTHRLRHTALTYWRDIGIPMSVIQYLAGHVEGSDITNDVYIDTSFEYVEKELKKIV